MKSTDVIPLVVYGVPLVGLLILSLLKPNAGRIGYALVFVLVGCGINYTVSFAYPGSMQPWSEIALLPFYRTIMATWLVPLGGFFWFATATYELVVALLLLSKGKWVKLGLVGGILFFLGITPIMVMTFPSIIGAAGLAFLLLSRGKWVKLGLVGGILFFLGITPIMVMTLPSIIGAAGLAFLLRKEYHSSVLDMLRARRHPGRAVA